jgi:RIO kinase 1
VPYAEDLEKVSDQLERRYEEVSLFKEKNRENFRVMEEVFDRLTIQGMLKLFRRGIIDELHGVVSSGKEARVYWAMHPEGVELAVKIYFTHTAEFTKGMIQYIQGDPRFKRIRKNTRSMIYTWTQKEYKNLQLCEEVGVNSPRPIDFYRNILVMTFIGEDGVPASLLRDYPPENPLKFYNTVIEQMRVLWQDAKLVHGDLSEYNIMNYNQEPIIFDVSQAMLTIHPMAEMLIERDIRNINKYFSKQNVETKDKEELKEWITGGTEDLH